MTEPEMSTDASSSQNSPSQNQDHPLYEGWWIVEDGLKTLGITVKPSDLQLSYDELRELAFMERWEKYK